MISCGGTRNVCQQLSGLRVWLSASIPAEAGRESAARIDEFTRVLTRAVLREGGQIVHGFHPSLAGPLLEEARAYRTLTGRKPPVKLIVSTWFREPAETYCGRPVAEIQQDCDLEEIPKALDQDGSLEQLRYSLAARADVLIAYGGRWWTVASSMAGVPEELNLAISRGIPSFLLGGFGGATSGYAAEFPEILRVLRNGLDEAANRSLLEDPVEDVGALVRKLASQMARLPLGRRETSSGQRFRILSLDGGGIRGAFTAAALAQWEEQSKLRVADHFDLIAGTSTGGILAIGLGLGLSAKQMLDFYRTQGPDIFPLTSFAAKVWRTVKHVAGAKFDAAVLEQKLRIAYDQAIPNATLKNSRQRLLIASYNLTTNDLCLFRTSHHPSAPGHDHLSAVAVARASSAAPTYFKPARVDELIAPYEAVDGGVWANCPALAALGEAVNILKVPTDRIDLLSVGTAGAPALVEDPSLEGQLGWAASAANLFMNSQMDATLLYTRELLGDRFVRVDDRRVEGLDDIGQLDFLAGKGVLAAQQSASVVFERFMNGVSAAPWRNP